MKNFDIEILGSSSKGNSIVYDKKIMVDIGLPYSKLKEALRETKLILLTHIHKDHLRPDVVAKIVLNHENIIFGCCYWMYDKLIELEVPKERIHLYQIGNIENYQTYQIIPIQLYHDVSNCGYRIIRNDGYKHLHITDTKTVEGISAENYDSALIECNYCEIRAKEIITAADEEGKFCHLKGSIESHLSVQQALDFVINNKIKKIVPAHMSDSTIYEVRKIIEKFKGYKL